MIYFIIIIFIVFIAFFIWMRSDYKKQKRARENKDEKSTFRSEEDLQEYGKKLKDGEENVVDFKDAE